MDKDIIQKIISQIDTTLEKKGIRIDKIEDFKKKLLKETEEKEKFLIENIGKEIQKQSDNFLADKLKEIEEITTKEREKIIDAIRGISIEPQITVEAPKVEVSNIRIPEIKIPQIIVPEAKIKVEIPEIKMPTNMSVEGLKDFIKELMTYLKQEKISNIDRDNPLPVILTDEKGNFYKAGSMMTGGIGVGGGSGSGNTDGILTETGGYTKQRMAYVSGTTNIEYLGEANPDAKTTEPKWKIKKFIYDVDGNILEINWAEGTTANKYVWDNRETYIYF